MEERESISLAAGTNAKAKLDAAAVGRRGLMNRLASATTRERAARQSLAEREAELATAQAALGQTRAALQAEQARRDAMVGAAEGANAETERLRAAGASSSFCVRFTDRLYLMVTLSLSLPTLPPMSTFSC